GQTNREGKLYASRDAVELSGGLVDQTVVSKWWRTGRQPSTTAPPRDVVRWRPGVPDRSGNTYPTLRRYLEVEYEARGRLPAGESLATSGRGRLMPGVREWVRRWVVGMNGVLDEKGKKLSLAKVAKLSGDLVSTTTVKDWWNPVVKEPPAEPPSDVVGWRPDGSPGSPKTLKDYLATKDMPEGESLDHKGKGKPSPEVLRWVRRWLERLLKENDPKTGKPYTVKRAIELSGDLFGKKVVDGARKEAAGPASDGAAGPSAGAKRTASRADVESAPAPKRRRVRGGAVPVPAGDAAPSDVDDRAAEAPRRPPETVERPLDQGRMAIETTWHSDNPDVWDEDVRILKVVRVRHRLVPALGMEAAFPWRDRTDPVNRVWEPFAGEDGQVHPTVQAAADQINRVKIIGLNPLKRIARDQNDPRLPALPARFWEGSVWPS
ncbi:MAG: hypothetical protein ACRDT8_23610, partial [Micromonosporaceae bacterium]